jgi:hypothetical protein
MVKNKSYNFIRFGALSQMNQLTYGNGTFHSPPKKKGIYAFPEGLVDRFLLTATNDPRNPSHKSYWLRDENGNKIEDKYFWDDVWCQKMDSYGIHKKYKSLVKKKKIRIKDIFTMADSNTDDDFKIFYVCVYKKPRKFAYDGDIWCHLGENLKPEHIIEESGSWVKVSMDDYLLALKKEKHKIRKEMMAIFGIQWKDVDPFRNYCTDHLEVFIEKIN